NGNVMNMPEHTPPRGDMIAVGHSECDQYFVLFNIVLCSSMFIDRDECKKHTHNTNQLYSFPAPEKLGVLFSLCQSVYDAIFYFTSTFACQTQKKRVRERFRGLKIDSRSSS
ncbi:hypothetical protein NO391_25915, partial [Escherichia coli]|nr:hypothetical protein [Escherichia coli]